MATRFEETLTTVRALQDSGASQEMVDQAISEGGYTTDRFDKAYDRFVVKGEKPVDVQLSPGGEKARRVVQSVTLGLSPHIEAAVRPGPYRQNLEALREEEDIQRRQNPVGAFTSDLVGGAVGGAPLALLKAPATIPRLIGQQTAIGGTMGGVQGALDARTPDRESMASGSLTGATVGGVMSAGAGLAVPVFRGGGKALWGAVNEKAAIENAEGIGIDKLTEALQKDGYDKAAIIAELNKYESPSMLSLLDLVHPQSNTAQLIRGAGLGSRPNRVDTAAILEERPIKSMQELPGEVTQRTGIRPIVGSEELDRLIKNRGSEANRLYTQAYKAGENKPLTDPESLAFFNNPYVQKVLMRKARDLYESKGWAMPGTTTQVPASIDPMTGKPLSFTTQTTPFMDVRLFDTLKKADMKTQQMYQRGVVEPGTGDIIDRAITAEFAKSTREPALAAVRKAIPEYDAALSKFKGDVEVEDAFELGRKLFDIKDPKELSAAVSKMSASEKEAFRSAAVNEYQVKMAKIAENRGGQATIVAETPDIRQRLRLLFDSDDDFGRYMTHLNKQAILARTKNLMTGGSPTTPLAISRDIATSPNSALGAAVQGNPAPLITNLLGRGLRGGLRAPQQAVDEATTRQGLQNQGLLGLEDTFATLRKRELAIAREQAKRGLYSNLVGSAARAGLLGPIQ
jgi:hypothetical protein